MEYQSIFQLINPEGLSWCRGAGAHLAPAVTIRQVRAWLDLAKEVADVGLSHIDIAKEGT
jgi:hypothetical protein